MGRRRSMKNEINKGTWSKEEDQILFNYVTFHGEGSRWPDVAKFSGLKRCAKSCRYRYLNYLRPGIKRGDISEDEENLIIALHRQLGNKWSLIAKKLPGRSDIEIKNYWKIYLSKKILHHHHKPQDNTNINLRLISNIQNDDGDGDGDDDDDVLDDFLLNNIIDQNDQIGNIISVNDLSSKIQQIKEKKKDEKKVNGRHRLKGAWSTKEDQILSNYVALHGEGRWEKVSQRTGLKRCGKSCRHRYLHYLKPGIKRGNFSKYEEDMITRLHHIHGNRWTLIAKNLPGRKDSEIKNHWHAYLSKKLITSHPKSSSPSSLQHFQPKPEEAKINSTVDASSQVDPNLEDNNTNTINNTPNNDSFSIEYDDAFLDDFLFNVLQNDPIGDQDLSSINITQIDEDHNNILASSSSSSIDHLSQLSEDVLDFWTSEFSFL